MSKYTSIILYVSGLEELEDRLTEVKNFQHNNSSLTLFDVNENFEPDAFPRFTYVGSYNYFNTDRFIEHIRDKVNWDYPEYVQLFIQEEGYGNCNIYINACRDILYLAKKIYDIE